MIDKDLARLYGVETRTLNQAVKRNAERFPQDFVFQLTKEECSRSQIVTLKDGRGGNLKYMPYAFTEAGVAMLSSVLRSKTAAEVNVGIMRAFTAMRRFMASNTHLFRRIEAIEHSQLGVIGRIDGLAATIQTHERRIEEIFERLDSKHNERIEGFFFDGQIFDAFTLISDFVRSAKGRIVLIDNYVDDRVLKTLDKRATGVNAIIYTDFRKSHIALDLAKHNAQYEKIEVLDCSNIHDRFLIVDETLYLIGGSIKDLGKKIVAFSRMNEAPETIISKLKILEKRHR